MPSLLWVALIQSVENLNRTKRPSKRELFLPDCFRWDIGLFLPLSSSWGWLFMSSEPASFQTGCPGSPTCPLQIWGFLSFHNQMNQFLIINSFTYKLAPFLWRTLTNTYVYHFIKKNYNVSVGALTNKRANAHTKCTGTLKPFWFLTSRSVGLLRGQFHDSLQIWFFIQNFLF